MMYKSKAKWILAMTVTALAIGALVVGGGLSSGIAQMGYPDNTNTDQTDTGSIDQSDTNKDQNGTSARQSWSGTLNSVVESANNEKQIVGGEWTLSLDGNNVTDFSADIDMISTDGNEAHTHRIVISGETLRAASAGNLDVTLVPTEQSAGRTVLLNVTGLAAGANVTIKMDDHNMGMTEADKDGNLLFALGTAESMQGPVIVSVEDGEGNSGSAQLTITEAESQNATGTSNTTESRPRINNNLTGTNTNNATTNANGTMPSSGDTSTATTGGTQNSTSSSDQPSYTIQTEIQSPTYGSGNTASPTMMSNDTTTSSMGSNLSNSDGTNATNTMSNATDKTSNRNVTSFEDESSVVAEITGNTMTFTTTADIYTNGELKWEDVAITVTLTNGKVLTIDIDPEATDGHFGQEPIYGIVTLTDDLFR